MHNVHTHIALSGHETWLGWGSRFGTEKHHHKAFVLLRFIVKFRKNSTNVGVNSMEHTLSDTLGNLTFLCLNVPLWSHCAAPKVSSFITGRGGSEVGLLSSGVCFIFFK